MIENILLPIVLYVEDNDVFFYLDDKIVEVGLVDLVDID